MFDSIISKVVLGWIRHGVLGLGAIVVRDGYLSADQGAQLTGAIMVIVPLAFSAYDKWQAQNAKDKAVIAAATAAKGPT